MDIMVMNKQFETIHVVDAYKSMIWTDRYREAGEFELYTEVGGETLNYVLKDYYLSIKDSKHTMMVNNIEILSDRDIGNYIKITGRSIEKIIDRRIAR